MTENNTLDKSFGPAGSTAGVIVFAAGLILTPFHFSGVILLLMGAFTGFSYSGTIIDYDRKRIWFSNFFFGFIPAGKWLPVEPSMKLGIKKSAKVYRVFSQGNRTSDTTQQDFRIILCDSENREIMEVKKCSAADEAGAECRSLASRLGTGLV